MPASIWTSGHLLHSLREFETVYNEHRHLQHAPGEAATQVFGGDNAFSLSV
jgi:hypothetical protein